MIVLEKVSKTYDTGMVQVNALKSLDLSINQGDFTAVMGPSGSGKSTLMNILGLLDRPSEGSFTLDGVDTRSLDESQLANLRNRKIGFVFQNFNLLPRLDALRNVELPLLYSGLTSKERRSRAQIALERVGLAGRIKHRPNEMSGGQKQRVAIARALVNNPGLLLADEPTGNLDSGAGYEIMELFQELHEQGGTILIVTHEHEIAHHTNNIIHFRDGHLVQSEAIIKPYWAEERLQQWLAGEEGPP